MTELRTFKGNTPLILAKEMVEYSQRYWGMYKYQINHGWLKGCKELDLAVIPDYPEIKCTLSEFLEFSL